MQRGTETKENELQPTRVNLQLSTEDSLARLFIPSRRTPFACALYT